MSNINEDINKLKDEANRALNNRKAFIEMNKGKFNDPEISKELKKLRNEAIDKFRKLRAKVEETMTDTKVYIENHKVFLSDLKTERNKIKNIQNNELGE